MHPEVLPNLWRLGAEELASRALLDGFYLAGGTGLALRFGHRRSVDLDLFRTEDFDPADLQDKLGGLSGLRIRQARRGTLHLELSGILVSFLHYPYPLLFPLARFDPLEIADARDIACMKLNAIATRGTRRDFIDLYVAAAEYGMNQILRWFDEKYAATPYNRVHLIKSLTWFADAEQEPMPDVLTDLNWDTVRRFFLAEAPRLL